MRRTGRPDIMKLIGAFRNRAEATKNKYLNCYALYFVTLTEFLAVIVVLKIYSTAVISCSFAVSITVVVVVVVVVVVATIIYFGVLNQNFWGLIHKNRAGNSCFVHNFGFPFFRYLLKCLLMKLILDGCTLHLVLNSSQLPT